MTEFVSGTPTKNDEPSYPYIAMRIPQGRAIVGEGAARQEGIRYGEVCFVPVNPLDPRAAVTHVTYLHDKKGYGFVKCGLQERLQPKHANAIAQLTAGWHDLRVEAPKAVAAPEVSELPPAPAAKKGRKADGHAGQV